MQLVLLHALPFDSRMWEAEMDLAPGRTLAPNLYQLGTSVAEWAEGVLALAGSDELIVVGLSVGGSCALEIARAAPERVAGLVLIGAKAGVRPEPLARDAAVRLLETQGLAVAWEELWTPLFGRSAAAAVLERARTLALSCDVAEVVRGVRAFHDRRDLTEVSRTRNGPLVLICGGEDRSPAPQVMKALADRPGRAFHLVEGCGHYVNLEHPAALRSILGPMLADLTDRLP